MANTTITTKEIAYVLAGESRDGILLAKMLWKSKGSETSVQFDWKRVLEREESKGDLVGFFHTHPDGFTNASQRDDQTMESWSFCFGKPLLCVIGTSAGLRAWIYDASSGALKIKEIKDLRVFRNNFLVAIL